MKIKKIRLLILLSATLFLLIYSLAQNNKVKNLEKDSNRTTRNENTISENDCLIGRDAPEGEYLFVNDKNSTEQKPLNFFGTYTIYSDQSKSEIVLDCETNRSLNYRGQDAHINVPISGLTEDRFFYKAKFKKAEVNEYSGELVYLKKGQMIDFENTKMYLAKYREKANPKKLYEGMYKVGRDIPPGRYKTMPFSPSTMPKNSPNSESTPPTLIVMTSVDVLSDNESSTKSYQGNYDEDSSYRTFPKSINLNTGEYIYFSFLLLKYQPDKFF